jgi:hypothetical protein
VSVFEYFCSPVSLIEYFSRQLTDDVVRENNSDSVAELIMAINVHDAHHNLCPKPYRWEAQAAAIQPKIQRTRAAQAKTVLYIHFKATTLKYIIKLLNG